MNENHNVLSLHNLFFVIAVALFILAGTSIVPAEPWRFRLLSWGLACWAISTALPW